jgi:uncharacterized protein (TIGR00290 family)
MGLVIGQPTRTVLAWSSGKDSAYALSVLRRDPEIEVVGLLTTVNSSARRVSMHGVRESILEEQTRCCGLPLLKVPLPDPCSNEQYEAAMAGVIEEARDWRVEAVAFGDLFLSEVRAYRERQLADTGLAPLFPLWGRATDELAREMIGTGLKAMITCVDTEQVDRSLLGRLFDEELLGDLPSSADPCGENGEFHTLAIAGPMFSKPLEVEIGEVVTRDRFVFVDVSLRVGAKRGREGTGGGGRRPE